MKLLATFLALTIVILAAVSIPLLGGSGHAAARIAVGLAIFGLAVGAGVALRASRNA
jgi:hypothetical protein